MGRRDDNSGKNPESWRVFCAIELPSDIRQRIKDHIDELRRKIPDHQASWSRVDNIHLTIKFFGDIPRNRIGQISAAAIRVIKDFPAFEIYVSGAGAFPKASHPKVLWIGVNDEQGNLAKLQEQFEGECAVEGFQKEDRAFRPHLTVARIRGPKGARALAEANQMLGFKAIKLPVNEILVFRSELSSQGSKYTAISRHKLSDML